MTPVKKTKSDGETSRSPEGSSSQENLNTTESTSIDNTLVQETSSANTINTSSRSDLPQQQQQQQLLRQNTNNNNNNIIRNNNFTSDFISPELHSSSETETESDEMKRAHAKELIEKYFYQLSEGCGNIRCTNKNCASSGEVKNLTPNQAAARAIQLFSEEAQLCDVPSRKIPRNASSSSPFPPSSSSASTAKTTPAVTANVTTSTAAAEATVDPYEMNLFAIFKKEYDMGKSEEEEEEEEEEKNEEDDEEQSNKSENSSISKTRESSETETEVSPETASSLPLDRSVTQTKIVDSIKKQLNNDHQSNAIKNSTNMNRTTLAAETLSYLDEQSLNKLIDHCKKTNSYTPLIRNIGIYFSSRETLSQSFQKLPTTHIDELLQKAPKDLKKLKKEDFRTLEGDLDKDVDSSCTDVNKIENRAGQKDYTNVDLVSLRRAMSNLLETKPSVFDALNNALQSLALSISVDIRLLTRRDKIEEIITVFVIIFEIIIIGKSDFVDVALPAICKAAAYLPVWAQARLASIWAEHCRKGLHKLVESLQQLISIQVITGAYHENVYVQDNEVIISATKVMKIVYYASLLAGILESPKLREEDNDADASMTEEDALFIYEGNKKSSTDLVDPLGEELNVNILDCRSPFIPFEEFYNEPLSDAIEMDNDYLNFKNRQNDKKFSFMLYSFILTPATKTLGLYYDCRIRMYSERRINSIHTQLAGQPSNPYLKLRVRRDHIIDDALVELEMIAMGNPKDLKKQLVVEFIGEQGIDEGGVSKEFFQLVVEQIFNPDYGMFVYQDDTKTVWFNSTSFENEAQFTLIGIVLGLAIYNNIILAVNFPMVVYRKLMGIRGSFADLHDWNPIIYNSLKSMLDYDGADMEDLFMQTFQISYQDVFGNVVTHDLKENADQIYVNQDNKKEFVDLYADYLLNLSVEKKFRAFRRGFQMVTDESPLHLLFRPEEVELLVCGSKDFDFIELEKACEYEGGYTDKSKIIRDFWETVHSFGIESKKKLLEFATGSDRVPVGGLSRLKLVIARNGGDSERLPTSHTCYNVLLLPEYSSKDKLAERLIKAINYSKGFGMI